MYHTRLRGTFCLVYSLAKIISKTLWTGSVGRGVRIPSLAWNAIGESARISCRDGRHAVRDWWRAFGRKSESQLTPVPQLIWLFNNFKVASCSYVCKCSAQFLCKLTELDVCHPLLWLLSGVICWVIIAKFITCKKHIYMQTNSVCRLVSRLSVVEGNLFCMHLYDSRTAITHKV